MHLNTPHNLISQPIKISTKVVVCAFVNFLRSKAFKWAYFSKVWKVRLKFIPLPFSSQFGRALLRPALTSVVLKDRTSQAVAG